MFIGTAGQEAVIGGNLLELHYSCCDDRDEVDDDGDGDFYPLMHLWCYSVGG